MNQKTIVGIIGVGIGLYLLTRKMPAQATAQQLGAVSPLDKITRQFLETKNWLSDQVKVVKEPYFSPDP